MPVSAALIEDACDGDLALSPLGQHMRRNLKIKDLQEERPSK